MMFGRVAIGAALMVAARATDLPEAVAIAAEALDSGAANALLNRWIAYP